MLDPIAEMIELRLQFESSSGIFISPKSKILTLSAKSVLSSNRYVSICFAEVNLMELGPSLVPFPKEVVRSNGTPYTITFESISEIFLGKSAKDTPTSPNSGEIKNDWTSSRIDNGYGRTKL